MTVALRAGLAARVGRLGTAAVARGAEALAARIAAEAPEIDLQIGEADVQLSAPGLRLRAFGSLKRVADVRLLAIIGGER